MSPSVHLKLKVGRQHMKYFFLNLYILRMTKFLRLHTQVTYSLMKNPTCKTCGMLTFSSQACSRFGGQNCQHVVTSVCLRIFINIHRPDESDETVTATEVIRALSLKQMQFLSQVTSAYYDSINVNLNMLIFLIFLPVVQKQMKCPCHS